MPALYADEFANAIKGARKAVIGGAAHMAPYMPKPMQDIGTQMHRAASRFSRTAQEAVVKGNMALAINLWE